MPVVPRPYIMPATGLIDSSAFNAGQDSLTFLLGRPVAALRSTAAQSLANATWVSINLDTADWDNYLGYSASTPSRYTAVYPGFYWLGGNVNHGLNATGSRGARWAVNGTAVNGGVGSLLPTVAASFGAAVPAPGQLVYLGIGDYVEIQGFQNSGGALSTGGCAVSLMWVGN